MFRTFTASILAAVMALTPMTATPARALDNNVERFLGGVAALVIIGSLLDGRRGHADVTVTHPHVVTPPPHVHRPTTHPVHPVRPVRPVHPNPPTRHDYRVLPSGCVRTLTTHTGPFQYLDRRCIAQNAPRATLPNACLRSIDGRKRDFTAYGARCLRRSGYVF